MIQKRESKRKYLSGMYGEHELNLQKKLLLNENIFQTWITGFLLTMAVVACSVRVIVYITDITWAV